MQTPPPPGVSALDDSGNHTPIAVEKQAEALTKTVVPVLGNKRNGRKVRRGDDPLQHPDKYKVLEGGTVNPTGTGTVKRDIREGKLPATRRPRRNMTSFESIDGNTYTFRTHDSKGKALPTRISQCLFLAMIEQQKGGSPFTVMSAFKLTMADADGQAIFPVPAHILNGLRDDGEDFIEDSVENEEFNLGE